MLTWDSSGAHNDDTTVVDENMWCYSHTDFPYQLNRCVLDCVESIQSIGYMSTVAHEDEQKL